jgi:hypothetical protein
MFGVAALLATLALVGLVGPAGQSRAEEKKAEAAEKLSPAAQAVQDTATANDLIALARRNQQATALLTAAHILASIEDPSGGKVEVEGASKAEAPTRKQFLDGLVAEAKKMKGGNSEAAAKLAEMVTEKIKENPRNTPNGGTSWSGIIEPYNGKNAVTLKRFFIGGQKATITVTRLVDKDVPLSVKVTSPTGVVIPPSTTNTLNYSWVVPRNQEGNHVIEIRDNHTIAVGIKVVTN